MLSKLILPDMLASALLNPPLDASVTSHLKRSIRHSLTHFFALSHEYFKWRRLCYLWNLLCFVSMIWFTCNRKIHHFWLKCSLIGQGCTMLIFAYLLNHFRLPCQAVQRPTVATTLEKEMICSILPSQKSRHGGRFGKSRPKWKRSPIAKGSAR